LISSVFKNLVRGGVINVTVECDHNSAGRIAFKNGVLYEFIFWFLNNFAN